MQYNILGVSIQKRVDIRGSQAIPAEIEPCYNVYIAWQSNQPSCGFMWRCTENITKHFPTEADFQNIAARGSDCMDKKLVKKLFPHLPGNALTD